MKKFNLDTKKSVENAVTFYNAQYEALEDAIEKSNATHMLPLMMLRDEVIDKINYWSSSKTWNFNFVGGGWNTVGATNKADAIKQAKKEYNSKVSTVDVKSFRVATEKDTKNLMSMFN